MRVDKDDDCGEVIDVKDECEEGNEGVRDDEEKEEDKDEDEDPDKGKYKEYEYHE